MKHLESKIQIAAVRYFRAQYPKLNEVFFSVPNGGKRTLAEAKIMKAEGIVSGVADLLLLLPNGEHAFLALECKTEKGRQTDLQKNWQKAVEKLGAKYVIFRSVAEFIEIIDNYLTTTEFGVKKF